MPHQGAGCWPSRWARITRGSASSCPVLRCVHVATILHCRGPKKISSVSNSWIYLSEYLAMSVCNKGFHLKLPHHFFWITRILLTNCLQGGVFLEFLPLPRLSKLWRVIAPALWLEFRAGFWLSSGAGSCLSRTSSILWMSVTRCWSSLVCIIYT